LDFKGVGRSIIQSIAGTTQCPWLITARRGQRINITLWDFASAAHTAAELTKAKFVRPCQAYAVIRERAPPARSFTVSKDYVCLTVTFAPAVEDELDYQKT